MRPRPTPSSSSAKDGSIIAVSLQSEDDENVNNAAVNFDAALQALGNDTFGGSEVKKIQDAVKTGQKSDRVGTTWGEFRLSNNGSLRLSGRKSGEDEIEAAGEDLADHRGAAEGRAGGQGLRLQDHLRQEDR